jgi:hypothetical protein
VDQEHLSALNPEWVGQAIYMADLVAGKLSVLRKEIKITTFTVNGDILLNALVPKDQWVWTTGSQLFTGSLRDTKQILQHEQYLNSRDSDAPPRWIHNSTALMISLTCAKQRRTSRARGQLVNHLYNWMAYEENLAKGATEGNRESAANCPLCGTAATQAHINSVRLHPAMMDQRQLLKRDIELHFLCLRYTVLPPAQRWILLLMHHAEEHLWEESEMAGNIWNGRWS